MVMDYDEKVSELEIANENLAAMNDLAAVVINNLQLDAENMKISINDFIAELRTHFLTVDANDDSLVQDIIEKHFDVTFEKGKFH